MTSSSEQSGAFVAASIVPSERIESCILLLRGRQVILDSQLAGLYGVELRALVQAVKRNMARSPADFMFQLTREEVVNLRSQFVISSSGHGGRRFEPYVFTEQGVAMLSGLLNSPRAIAVNIGIMRAFVRLRQLIASHADLARKLADLECKYDEQFKIVFDAIRELMEPPAPRRHRELEFHAAIAELRPARSGRKSRRRKSRSRAGDPN